MLQRNSYRISVFTLGGVTVKDLPFVRRAGLAIQRIVDRTATPFVVALIYFLVAAAAFNGFYQKWGFREDSNRSSYDLMLSGEAHRPFVYRQLNVWVAKSLADATLTILGDKIVTSSLREDRKSGFRPDSNATTDRQSLIAYAWLYYLVFGEFVIGLFALQSVCRYFVDPAAAAIAPLILALCLPLFQVYGGYFYDLPEIAFLSIAALLALRGWGLALVPLSVLAVLNKEAFLFYVPSLLPFMAITRTRIWASIAIAISVVACALAYVLERIPYANNAGGTVEYHLWDNLKFYVNPLNYLGYDLTYGVPVPNAHSVIWIGFVGVLAVVGWRSAPPVLKSHVTIAVVINVVLFALFAYHGEMRNLSLTYVGWTLLTALAIQRWLVDRGAAGRTMLGVTP